MANENREKNTPLIKVDESYFTTKHALSFFQAVRLLLQTDADAVKPGYAGPVSKEAVFFKANASLAFPVREIEDIEFNENPQSHLPTTNMTVNFLGLYGPSSPLPDHYTETILFADPSDSNIRRFLDVFNHRYISYIYRCWEKYQYSLQYTLGATDKFSKWVLSFIGLYHQELRKHSHLDWQRLIPLTGLLGMGIGSAWVLKQVISIYFGLENVSIEQNIETQIDIEQQQLNQLGFKNMRLGLDITLGNKIKDCSSKFRVCIGPLKLSDYQLFLRNGKNYKTLQELVLLTICNPLNFETRLTLQADAIPKCMISKKNEAELGMTTWLGGQPKKSVSAVTIS